MTELRDPPHKTFADLMDTKELPTPKSQLALRDSCRYFQSTVRPYRPIVAPGVFGGHVLAQCAVVGAKTVADHYILHNVHGYFILPGKQDIPFTYKVETVRTGRSYSVRQIRVYQPDPEKVSLDDFDFAQEDMCFMCICSYKRIEQSILKHQRRLDPVFRPENLPHPVDHIPLAPDVDVPTWEEWAKDPDNKYVQEVHPVELRKMPMKDYNHPRADVADRRQIHYLRSHDRLPDDPNLHIAAMLYASDRNSLFTVINLQDDEHAIARVASIDHAFIMHELDVRVDEGWLTMETFSERSGDGRGLYNGRMFDKNNRHVCTFMQDGVVRVFPKEGMEEDANVKVSSIFQTVARNQSNSKL
uniref:ARAD1C40788p n=2 Tax=Blastobotrys adeninivorans TaxID=409370 RepID=A0A060T940_BLAAD